MAKKNQGKLGAGWYNQSGEPYGVGGAVTSDSGPYASGAGYVPSGAPDEAFAQNWEAPAQDDGGDGGGYSGGGGGGGVYDPTSDPTYQAYISALDLDLAQRQSDTERRRAQLLGQQDNLLYDTAQQGTDARTNINNSAESRGLFNSGARLRDISRQQANQGTRESRIKQGTAQGISDLEYALAQAQAQAQLKRQSASQGLFS